jgi:hypothetical protein
VIYQHPLGYLLGLEGLALLRAFNGEHGRDFTLARSPRSGPCWTTWTRPGRRRKAAR